MNTGCLARVHVRSVPCISGLARDCSELGDSLCRGCLRFVPKASQKQKPRRQTDMHIAINGCLTGLSWPKNEVQLFPTANPGDSKTHLACVAETPGLSSDRKNSSTAPCLQARIMPAPIEIFDSDLGPVWSCMPSPCARIFSGLQVSAHDTALRNAKTDKMNYYPQFDWTVSSGTLSFFFFFFFWQTWQRCVSSCPFLCSNNSLSL